MSNPTIDIWPILERLGIKITENAGVWSYHVVSRTGKAISGSGAATAEEALEEALTLLIGYMGAN